jgi:ribosomal protein L3 glutamine methyltransferase
MIDESCNIPMTNHPDATATLITLRDWLRYATTRFSQANLVYGHGTSRALDEAAFLILEHLRLPIDSLEPWLDAKLTLPERESIAALIDQRITTRKPAAYLVNAAYIQGHRFYIDDRVIVPRSYLGELLLATPHGEGLAPALDDDTAPTRILDVCTGSGCLAILAALVFDTAHVDAVEISPDALEVAARNVADYGLNERITLIQSDLLASLAADARYDLILANPPYVAAAEVAAFAPEYRAEPVLAHAGGEDGLDLVHTILREAPAHLAPNGTLVVEIGTGREHLEAAYPDLPFLWLDTAESEGEVFALSAQALKPNRRKK